MTSPEYPELEQWSAAGRRVVHESDTKTLLARMGIATPKRAPAQGMCAVKLSSDLFPHKTEHGLLRLGVPAEQAAEEAAQLQAHDPEGEVLIEEMIEDGVAEWIVGCRHDPVFGPIIVIGPGGVLVELLDTACVRMVPLDHAAARQTILRKPQAAKMLAGVRGRQTGDVAALADLVVRLSEFFVNHADQVQEIEINPVIVLPEGRGVMAVDALMTLV